MKRFNKFLNGRKSTNVTKKLYIEKITGLKRGFKSLNKKNLEKLINIYGSGIKGIKSVLKKNNIKGYSKLNKKNIFNLVIKNKIVTNKKKVKIIIDEPEPEPEQYSEPEPEQELYTGYVKTTIKFIDGKRTVKKMRYKVLDRFHVTNATRDDIQDIAEEKTVEYFNEFAVPGAGTFGSVSEVDESEYIGIQSISPVLQQTQDGNIGFMNINDVKFNKLNLNIQSNNDKINDNCVHNYIYDNYKNKKGCKKLFKTVIDKKNWKLDELCEFLKLCKIPFICYTQNLKIYKRLDTKGHFKKLLFIASNEHMYPVTKKEIRELFKYKKDKLIINKIEYIEDLNEFVKNNVKDEQIKKFSLELNMTDDEFHKAFYDEENYKYQFSRILIKDVLYVNCVDTVESYHLFKEIMGFFPISYNYKMYDPLVYIANLHNLHSTYDTIIDRPSSLYYNDPTIKYDLKAIDKNKSHSSSFYDLEYIPKLNSTTFIEKYDDSEIVKHNFYYISEIKNNYYNNIKKGWVSGYRIHGLKDRVIIKYMIKPLLIKNPFKETIKKILDKNQVLGKYIINVFCGIMTTDTMAEYTIFDNLTISKDEASEYDDVANINDMFYAEILTIPSTLKFKPTLKPLSIFINDNAIYKLRQKIEMLKKMDDKFLIRSLKTDCIVFKSDKIDLNELDLDANDFTKWKKEKCGQLINCENTQIDNELKKVKNLKTIKYEDIEDWGRYLNKNLLFDCYAGTGKTYFNINVFLPLIKDKKKLIISTKHSALSEYYEMKENAKVIHYYLFNPIKNIEFRKYDYIIVDECGLLETSHYEYIYKNIGTNTKLIFLGDKDQLLPFGYKSDEAHPLFNMNILKMFDYKILMTKNRRNNYTIEQYEEMKTLKYTLTDYENKLLNRYGKLNVAVTRRKMDEINQYYINDWVDNFGGLKVKKGGLLISEFSNLNTYSKFSKMDLYNASFLTIIDYDNEKITLKDIKNNEFIIKEEDFKYNFNYGYCITTFRSQGMSIPYEDYGIWEIEKIKNNGRQLYTVFSRIKEIIN